VVGLAAGDAQSVNSAMVVAIEEYIAGVGVSATRRWGGRSRNAIGNCSIAGRDGGRLPKASSTTSPTWLAVFAASAADLEWGRSRRLVYALAG